MRIQSCFFRGCSMGFLFCAFALTARMKAQCAASNLIGLWAGQPMSSLSRVIDISLSFNPDGTYRYAAGQGNAIWLRHFGTYKIGDGADSRWRCTVTLTPEPSTIELSGKEQLLTLQSRDLIDDQARTYLYKFFPDANRLMMAGTWTDWRNDVGSFGLNRK